MGLTNQAEHNTQGSPVQRFVKPLAHPQEAVSVRDVVDEHDAVGATGVAFGDDAKSLLVGLAVHRKRRLASCGEVGGVNQPYQIYSAGTARLQSASLCTAIPVSNSY